MLEEDNINAEDNLDANAAPENEDDIDINLDDVDLEGLNLDDDEDEAPLEEQTAAAKTIEMKPSRSVNIANAVAAMASMSDDDLNHFAASIAKPNTPIPDGAAAKNKASVAMKTVTKEEMEDLFGDDLSEEFRDKTRVLFESAVNTQVSLQVAEIAESLETKYDETVKALEEAYATTLEEEVMTLSDTLYEQVDSYINHVAESWIEENAVAIDRSLRAEIAEGFMDKMKDLFLEHNLNIPDESEDVIAEMIEVNEDLENRLNEAVEQIIALKEGKMADEAAAALTEETSGLAATQIDKIRQLAEGIEFEDLDTYRKKLGVIKEHVTKKSTPSSGILVEEAPAVDETALNEEITVKPSDPRMRIYAEAISRQVKN